MLPIVDLEAKAFWIMETSKRLDNMINTFN